MVNLDGLNDAQRAAVTSVAPRILVIAGAGSGKTRVLVHRIAWLHEEQRVGTGSICALTFTRLAAKEMKDRLKTMIGAEAVRDLFAGTFHAFCVHIIRRYHDLVGLDESFSIWDEEDKIAQIEAIIEELQYKNVKAREVIEAMRQLEAHPGDAVRQIISEYKYRLKQNNAMDLDGLLRTVADLLSRPEIAEDLRREYQYVFVDEYQDTDPIQDLILERLAPENLFVVGDPDQAIYGFRGACVGNILSMAADHGVEIHRLEDNYRSTHQIVEAANNLISHNAERLEKALRAHQDGYSPDYWERDTDAEEAQLAAVNAISLHDKGYKYSDIAVLARTNRQIDKIAEEMDEVGMPYLILGRHKNPFNDQEIRGLLSWLEVVNNPKDGYHLRRVIRYAGGQALLDQAELAALKARSSVWDQVRTASGDRLEWVREKIREIKEAMHIEGETAGEEYLVRNALADVARVICVLAAWAEAKLFNRIERMERVTSYIGKWEDERRAEGSATDLPAFLHWVRTRDMHERLAIENSDAVRLMTVHAAKGLEFPVVILVGMAENTFPHLHGDIEEERRLAYVAITRAKERLILTRSMTKEIWPGKPLVQTKPSRFLREMQKARLSA
jgi:DNA helicase-2/ATP-dependent DNA helicase PcrA